MCLLVVFLFVMDLKCLKYLVLLKSCPFAPVSTERGTFRSIYCGHCKCEFSIKTFPPPFFFPARADRRVRALHRVAAAPADGVRRRKGLLRRREGERRQRQRHRQRQRQLRRQEEKSLPGGVGGSPAEQGVQEEDVDILSVVVDNIVVVVVFVVIKNVFATKDLT